MLSHKASSSHCYCWRESHQECRSWLTETLCSSAPRNFCLLLLSKTLLEFKYSLFKQFHWETLQQYRASLPNPSPHPNLLLTADLERAWRHPYSSGLQFVLPVLTLALPDVPREKLTTSTTSSLKPNERL